jgi:hypothetical protein
MSLLSGIVWYNFILVSHTQSAPSLCGVSETRCTVRYKPTDTFLLWSFLTRNFLLSVQNDKHTPKYSTHITVLEVAERSAIGHMLTHHCNENDSLPDILQFGTGYTSHPVYTHVFTQTIRFGWVLTSKHRAA